MDIQFINNFHMPLKNVKIQQDSKEVNDGTDMFGPKWGFHGYDYYDDYVAGQGPTALGWRQRRDVNGVWSAREGIVTRSTAVLHCPLAWDRVTRGCEEPCGHLLGFGKA